MMQDSKHLLKTFRNNAFSGAQALILGNHHVAYHQFRSLAFPSFQSFEGSAATLPSTGGIAPLYHHDVEKLGQQDDAATT